MGDSGVLSLARIVSIKEYLRRLAFTWTGLFASGTHGASEIPSNPLERLSVVAIRCYCVRDRMAAPR